MLNKILQNSIFGKSVTKKGLLRLYRTKKGLGRKEKEKKKKSSASDDKMIKLTKKEDLQAKEKREKEMRERRQLRVDLSKKFDYRLEFALDDEVVDRIQKARKKNLYDHEKNPQGMYELYNQITGDYLEEKSSSEEGKHRFVSEEEVEQKYSPLNAHSLLSLEEKQNLAAPIYTNAENDINSKYFANSLVLPHNNRGTKRCGALGKKVGMIHVYDNWGVMTPVTVLHVDRCQVTQIFTEETNGFNAVQVGMGQKSFRNVKKSEIGHCLKAGVPPKVRLRQYEVDADNILPLGFMIGPRHFTPGQFIDIKAVAKNKGVTGAVKKWGFGGQSASHGTTKTHRTLGSTGQCQDAGRVFKGKRMHGQMGGKPVVMRNLEVFRIDHERSLLFVKGSVPGKKNEIVEIYDSFMKVEHNADIVNYPTFVPQEGERYANVVQVEAQELDPNEIYLHDEALPKDDEEDE